MSKKILVVDDETKIRRILRQALTREGFSILEAANAKEALEKRRAPNAGVGDRVRAGGGIRLGEARAGTE